MSRIPTGHTTSAKPYSSLPKPGDRPGLGMPAKRPNKRNATAMGKRIAEHVMMHAGETSQVEYVQALLRSASAREGEYERIEAFVRRSVFVEAAERSLAVVALKPWLYAVNADRSADSELMRDKPADQWGMTWSERRPDLADIPVDAHVEVRLTAFAVPLLEVK